MVVNDNTRIIIRLRRERCHEDLEVARNLLEQGRYRHSISRAYYAAFALASAALLLFGVRRGKHTGVESAFHQYLVKPGHIEPEYGTIYTQAMKSRHDADYEDRAAFDAAKASAVLADVERFVARLEEYLRSVGAID
jgi:uncharacterized protein (UPF0332 family)